MQWQSLFQESTQAKVSSNGLDPRGPCYAVLYKRRSLQCQHRTSLLVQPGEHTPTTMYGRQLCSVNFEISVRGSIQKTRPVSSMPQPLPPQQNDPAQGLPSHTPGS